MQTIRAPHRVGGLSHRQARGEDCVAGPPPHIVIRGDWFLPVGPLGTLPDRMLAP